MIKAYLIPIVLVFLSCNSMKNSTSISSEKSKLFTELVSAPYQGRASESNVIVTNQKELEALYQSVGNEEVPKIDFSKSQVVALFLGTKNTGGYTISIDRVEEQEGKLHIYKKVETPKRMATMAISNPFVIAEIHSKKEIIFK